MAKTKHWDYRHQKAVSRTYSIKDDAFVRYITASIKATPREDILWRLDDYERALIKMPSKWARTAPMEQIMVLMAKLSIPLILVGYDATSPHKAFTMTKWRQNFAKKKDVNGLLKQIADHKFFSLCGRDTLKAQGLYSQLVNGNLYVPNNDFRNFLKNGMNADGYAMLKDVDIVLGAAFLQNGYGDLDDTDLAILYLCKRYDDLPLSVNAVFEIMEYRRDHHLIQRHIGKLSKQNYVMRHGVKNDAMLSLTEKGMLILNKARKAFFQDAQFWNQKNPNEAFKKQEA